MVAVASKLVGCGIPAAHFLKNKDKGYKVGVGMISRGEVGLIIAGVAITSGVINQSTYAAIIGMIIITTILAPILLKRSYDKTKTTVTPQKSSTIPEVCSATTPQKQHNRHQPSKLKNQNRLCSLF